MNRTRKALKPGYESLTTDKAYILGVLCGDGCLPRRGRTFQVRACDEDFVLKVQESISNVYGFQPSMCREQPKDACWHRTQILVTACSTTMVDDLRGYGPHMTKDWSVPDAIFEADASVKAAWLRGFYDSEGYVQNPPKTIAKTCVQATTTNTRGMGEVLALLSTMGISARINVYSPKQGEIATITIGGYARISLFARLVNFTIARKRERLAAIVARYEARGATPTPSTSTPEGA